MKRSVLADTGPLYAAADPDDAYHQRAQEEIHRLTREKREVLIAYSTLLEAYTLVLFRLGKEVARQWLSDLNQGARFLNPTPDDYQKAAAKVQLFSDQSITLFDATNAVIARRMEIEVWTYDHHFDLMQVRVWR